MMKSTKPEPKPGKGVNSGNRVYLISDDDDDIQFLGTQSATDIKPSHIANGVSTYNPPSAIQVRAKARRNTSTQNSRASTSTEHSRNAISMVIDDDIEIIGHRGSQLSSRQPTPSTSTVAPQKRKAGPSNLKQETIELSDDGEVHVITGRERKRLRRLMLLDETNRGPRIASTETLRTPSVDQRVEENIPFDEDYVYLEQESLWSPIGRNPNKIEKSNPVPEQPSSDDKEPTPCSIAPRRRLNIYCAFPSPKVKSAKLFIWDMLPRLQNTTKCRKIRPALASNTRSARGSLDVELDLHGLKETACYKECPGSIVRIAQRKGWVVAGGACNGGGADTEDETLSPYNRSGSLTTYNYAKPKEKRVRKQEGHQKDRVDGETKHYAINDIKFLPHNRTAFISSGYDCHVRICDRAPNEYLNSSILKRFDYVPHELVFKPDESTRSVLAVGERRVYIFDGIRSNVAPAATISIAPAQAISKNLIGAIRWGVGVTSGLLFASSEPCEDQTGAVSHTGYHRAVDVSTGKSIYPFDASEAGDSMITDPFGDSLILTTRGDRNSNILRVYDIRRKARTAEVKIDLEPYSAEYEAEIHDTGFSPDGVYLALGRHDNETHVYDSRALQRGPLFRYRHTGPIKTPPDSKPCGITKLEWLSSPSGRLGLLTGGSDGCVRLWDPLEAGDNGAVLVEAKSDIATFSLGDRYQGEHQLIVGDTSGEISIFDRLFEVGD